jgi:hypothetical protein
LKYKRCKVISIEKIFLKKQCKKLVFLAGHWCLMPVTLATEEAEIKKIEFQSQHRQIVHGTLN